MTLADLHKQLSDRYTIYARQLAEKRTAILVAEQALIRARCEADTMSGALQGTERALADVEQALRLADQPVPVLPASA